MRPTNPARTRLRVASLLMATLLAGALAGCSSQGGNESAATTLAGANGSDQPTGSTSTTPTTTSPDVSTGSATSAPPPAALWLAPDTPAATAQDAALRFATQYLGLANPQIVTGSATSSPLGPPVSAITGATVVRVRPNGAGAATAISVVHTDEGWRVVRADADTIRLASITPTRDANGDVQLAITGTSQTFEGNVVVQARSQAFEPATGVLASTTALGGAADGPARFSATLHVSAASAHGVVAVLLGQPDASGQLTEATVVAVALPT